MPYISSGDPSNIPIKLMRSPDDPLDPMEVPLDTLEPLNIPIELLGPSRSPVSSYKSSEDLPNVADDPIGRPRPLS